VETRIVTSLPLILSQPLSQTNIAGTDADFSVVAGGTPPLRYQWLKDGTNIAGATAPLLALTNIQQSAQGSYSVVVSNAFGSTASSPACLVVNQPPCRFTSVGYESNGRVRVQFFAPAGLIYVVGSLHQSRDLGSDRTGGRAGRWDICFRGCGCREVSMPILPYPRLTGQ
jgi:hypothetical protein